MYNYTTIIKLSHDSTILFIVLPSPTYRVPITKKDPMISTSCQSQSSVRIFLHISYGVQICHILTFITCPVVKSLYISAVTTVHLMITGYY